MRWCTLGHGSCKGKAAGGAKDEGVVSIIGKWGGGVGRWAAAWSVVRSPRVRMYKATLQQAVNATNGPGSPAGAAWHSPLDVVEDRGIDD